MTKGKGQPQAYGDESYWNERYSQDVGSFDWYQTYANMAPLINMYIPKSDNVLMVGCGNAVISEEMINDGYETITNIDISQVVIDAMKEKYKNMPQLRYQRMDVRQLNYKAKEFDSVIDKGMLDSLMCGPSASTNVASMIKEIYRVLKPGGVYMLITYGDPRVRVPHLKSDKVPWDIKLHAIRYLQIFICIKLFSKVNRSMLFQQGLVLQRYMNPEHLDPLLNPYLLEKT
ncbi:hypothetical protein KC19_11G092000 [Ceratodon purpureus]|uniref:Methyltransferase type 11 domain-containing protein n=1 Tax=Ceratodon purpureus TaxID=3225 RepID=A0A8T0GD60_CERPU|nr:hypothetical protein KC19_11G092000 [Ceratodon purpureus]